MKVELEGDSLSYIITSVVFTLIILFVFANAIYYSTESTSRTERETESSKSTTYVAKQRVGLFENAKDISASIEMYDKYGKRGLGESLEILRKKGRLTMVNKGTYLEKEGDYNEKVSLVLHEGKVYYVFNWLIKPVD